MKRKTAAAVISILSAAVLVLGIVAGIHVHRARKLEYYVRAQTQWAFSELVEDVSVLSEELEKCVYVSSPALQSALCTQVYGKALEAQMALGSLPYEAQAIEQTASFVSRVGDYACVLSRSVGNAGGYSEEELENLQALAQTAEVMAGNLRELEMQLANGTMTMDTALLDAAPPDTVLLSSSLSTLESEFPTLPTLIYDGPFSDALHTDDPKLLRGAAEVDESAARAVAARMLGVSETSLRSAGECGGDVPCWCFAASLSGGEYAVSVTKSGGEVWSVLSSRSVRSGGYSVADGLRIAQDILAAVGLEDMHMSYHIVQNGVLTVNFNYRQEDVTCYGDLVKIGVALDNGTLQSYDASGYIRAHCQRNLPAVTVDAQSAQAALSEALAVEKASLALIPMDGGEERLCHEFLCSSGERRCLIYVNAVTGAEERILLLLEDEAGTLTI